MVQEVYALFGMVITGFAAGILFDVLYAIRSSIKIPAAVTDALFWIVSIAGVASAFIYFNNSVIRGFEIIGLIIGVILYFLTISRPVKRCFMGIFKFFFKKVQFICKILLTPLRFLYKMLYIEYFLKLKKGKNNGN